MTRRISAVTAAIVALALGALAATTRSQPEGAAVDPRLTERVWLGEIVRYLYRWRLDERDIEPVAAADEIVFWVRDLHPPLDEGDRSRFGEVVLPQFGMTVRVKQADYEIPELDAVVKNEAFRIVGVSRSDIAPARPENSAEIRFDYTDLRDELFRTRALAGFPEGELLERLRAAVRSRIAKSDLAARAGDAPVQVVHLAPLSPVANETWVFWETGRVLIRFASDIDLTNPAVWAHEELAVDIIDLSQDVVVTLDEVAGSNAFVTRDHAGRVLFNCMVLGRRVELTPPAPE